MRKVIFTLFSLIVKEKKKKERGWVPLSFIIIIIYLLSFVSQKALSNYMLVALTLLYKITWLKGCEKKFWT